MFLTFSQIFSASKQIYYQIQQNPDSSKPKFSIPNKKKFIKLEINPKSKNNKTRTTHATTTTTRKLEIKESKRIGDKINPKQADRQFSGKISGLTNGATISGFATISGEWVWRFLGSQRLVTNGFDDFWVRDLRNRFDSVISLSLSLSLCLRVWVLPSLALSLSLGIAQRTSSVLGFLGSSELLDVDWSHLHRCWGAGAISLPCCLFLSSIFLGRKWFEVKIRTEIIFRPLSLILRSNWKHF